MPNESPLDGLVAVVTGAGGAIGRAVVDGLVAHGASVVGIDVDRGRLERTELAVRGGGGATQSIAMQVCDVTQERAVAELFSSVISAHGKVDILVNTAFVLPAFAKPEQLKLNDLTESFRVNVGGYFLCAQQAGSCMMAQGTQGSIVNLGSVVGERAIGRGALAYSVAKAGVHQLTRELAVEWASRGIRVNTVAPCQVSTDRFERWLEQMPRSAQIRERMLAGIPAGRFAVPDDVVGAVVFLASPASRFVTGTVVPVDGGNLAMDAGGSS